MKTRLLKYLACPGCRGEVRLLESSGHGEGEDGEIVTGRLGCKTCQAEWPVVNAVPRFVPSDAYTESFGFQWNYFRTTQMDSAMSLESRLTFERATGIQPESLGGRLVLDAGCGMGRFSDVCAKAGAEVLAVDLSSAVEAAFGNIGTRPNMHIIQADIFALPLRPALCDLVFSIGVLHHTPDTRRAFQSIARHVAPGGQLAVWVYSGHLRHRIYYAPSDLIRLITVRMDRERLLRLCRVAVPLYYVHRLPVVGLITRWLLFTSIHPRSEWRVLDTFDWYSARYHWRTTIQDLNNWFLECGFHLVQPNAIPVSAVGVRPEAVAQ